jgi:hypothetical protein
MHLDKVNYHGPFVADTAVTITEGARTTIDRATFKRIERKLNTHSPGPLAGARAKPTV